MFFFNSSQNKSSFQVAVGNEGAVVVYIKNGRIEKKMFLRTTSPHDTVKLAQWLEADPNAEISLYLDTLDQTYVQRNIAYVYTLNSDSIAQSRLDKEVPEDYLKLCVKLGENNIGRKDWIYTFASAPYEEPLSKWVDFFIQYENIIGGIYFLPVELAKLLPLIRGAKANSNGATTFLGSLFGKARQNKNIGCELLVTLNKASGFRQTAFWNGKIVFSRILGEMSSTNAQVLAGNIEFQVMQSIDYLSNILRDFDKNALSLYIVVSSDIASAIRIEKLPTNTKIYQAYQFARLLGIDAVTENDKFVDPIELASLSFIKTKVARLHIKISEKVYLASKYVARMKLIINIFIPVLIYMIFHNLYHIISDELSTFDYNNLIQEYTWSISDNQDALAQLSQDVSQGLPINQVVEIVDLHKFLLTDDQDPIKLIMELSKVLPGDFKIKSFKWNYTDPALTQYTNKVGEELTGLSPDRAYKVEVIAYGIAINDEAEEVDLELRYREFAELLKHSFVSYDVSASPLSMSINSLNGHGKPMFEIRLTHNKGLD